MSTSKKQTLFDDEVEEGQLNINAEFARRFEHNKRRELLDKAKEKYGDAAILNSDEESSEEIEDEDDDGELINAAVEKKFLETIAMIRSNDPKLKQSEGEVFRDEDFSEEDDDQNQKGKAVTYKDLIREDVLKKAKAGKEDESSSDDEMQNIFMRKKGQKETLREEEDRLKKEFKQAADREDDDDDFLKKVGNDSEEDQEDEEDIPEDLEALKVDKVLTVAQKKAKKELNLVTDQDLLKRFYGDESQLDKTDKFLRNYILL